MVLRIGIMGKRMEPNKIYFIILYYTVYLVWTIGKVGYTLQTWNKYLKIKTQLTVDRIFIFIFLYF